MVLFNLDIYVIIRIILFVVIIFIYLAPFLILKKLKVNSYISIIATIWYIYGGGNTLTINFISYGMMPYLISVIITAFFILNIIFMDFKTKRDVFPFYFSKKDMKYLKRGYIKRDISNIFLLSMIILFNFTTIIFLLFFLIIFITARTVSYRDNKEIIMNILRYLSEISVMAGLITAFWLIPSIFIQYPNMGTLPNNLIFSQGYGELVVVDIIHREQFIIISFFILIASIILTEKLKTKLIEFDRIPNNNNNNYNNNNLQSIRNKIYMLAILTFSILIFVTLLPHIDITILWGINSYRYYVFFEIFLPVTFIYVYFYYIPQLLRIRHKEEKLKVATVERKSKINEVNMKRRLIKYIRVNIIKPITKKRLKRNFISFLFIVLVIVNTFLMFWNATRLSAQESKLDYALEGPDYKFYPHKYTIEGPYVDELFNWLENNIELFSNKLNPINKTRILFENSGEEGALRLGGHILGPIALKYNVSFIGGYLSHFWYKYAPETSFHDGLIFGIPAENITREYFLERCKELNIEYIISWTTRSHNFFYELLNKTNPDLELLHQIGDFNIYRLKSPSRSWIFTLSENNNGDLVYNNSPQISGLNWRENLISFKLSNVTYLTNIYFSMHDFPNWHIYINNKEVKKLKNSRNFIEFQIPKDLNLNQLNIRIIWKESIYEYLGWVISCISISLIILSMNYNVRANVYKFWNQKLQKR
ncbi:MAG: hypothetical protein ACTSXF_14620 [Promethearchaeota archaeon]